eukprot:2638227-Rhodomonas_salina.1
MTAMYLPGTATSARCFASTDRICSFASPEAVSNLIEWRRALDMVVRVDGSKWRLGLKKTCRQAFQGS